MNEDPRYRDLMQEIKERIHSADYMLSSKTALSEAIVLEFCFLQLRLICECIAFACVIAHEYIEEIRAPKIQKQWSADALMKALSHLHQDFFPVPKIISVENEVVNLEDVTDPYLTKADILKLYALCNDKLHRGSPKKYMYVPKKGIQQLQEDRKLIIEYANKTWKLLDNHWVSHRDESRFIICRLQKPDVPAEVWYAGPRK